MLLIWLAFIPLGTQARGVNALIESLRGMPCYSAQARVTVSPAGGGSEIEQLVRLHSSPASDTVFSRVSYLVELEDAGGDPYAPFSAFTGQSLYKWDGRMMRQYDVADSEVTTTLVATAPFTELLPAVIASTIEREMDGPCAEVDYDGESGVLVIRQVVDSMEYARKRYRFDPLRLTPLSIDMVNNQGTPMESSMTVTYVTDSVAPAVDAVMVYRLHGDVMGRFADDNLCPESFLDFPVPQFNLREVSGNRYEYRPGYETLMIFLDGDDPEEMLQAVEEVIEARPELKATEILYILTRGNIDGMRANGGVNRRSHVLLNGAHLARQLGASRFPLFVLVDGTGVVDAVGHDVNNNIPAIVNEILSE